MCLWVLDIEYAIYRVPLLGAILLSGFVRKGDTVEVPVPWPEVWGETVGVIYTGSSKEEGGVAGGEDVGVGGRGRGGRDKVGVGAKTRVMTKRERTGEMVRDNLEFLGWKE